MLRWTPLVCVCLAEALIFATLQDAPNVAQSLYLRVPMLAYTCPLIVLTIYGGWLASKWETAKDRNREFKYYRLTTAGKKQLTVEESNWKQLAGAIARVMWPAEEG